MFDTAGRFTEDAHGLVGAGELGHGAAGGGTGFVDLTAGIDSQGLHVARGGGDIGNVLGGLRRPIGRRHHLLRHLPIGLRQFRGGAANALAGIGESVDDIIDAALKIAGEKVAPGMMQPGLGFAPAPIDRERIGLDQRGAYFPGAVALKLRIAPSPSSAGRLV
ncbi:MAG: hypothetical protein WCG00_00315 [Hyphomicrobiales bacterium]